MCMFPNRLCPVLWNAWTIAIFAYPFSNLMGPESTAHFMTAIPTDPILSPAFLLHGHRQGLTAETITLLFFDD